MGYQGRSPCLVSAAVRRNGIQAEQHPATVLEAWEPRGYSGPRGPGPIRKSCRSCRERRYCGRTSGNHDAPGDDEPGISSGEAAEIRQVAWEADPCELDGWNRSESI